MNELSTIRSDVVGSFLRPAGLKEIRLLYDDGKANAKELRIAQDKAIRNIVRLQEEVGLAVVTDGEFRRLNFQDSFGESVFGFKADRRNWKSVEDLAKGGEALMRWEIPPELEKGASVLTHRRSVVERLQLAQNIPLDEYLFVSQMTRIPAKVTLIGPDRISQRFDYENSTSIYQSMDEFLSDVVYIEREIIGGLVQAGCRYVQFDAPGYTAYVDPPSLAAMRRRGEDPMANFSRSLKADNEILKGFDDVTFGIHLCRGNQRSMWHREGAYDAIAEQFFHELNHDRFLLEYDSSRAGTFAPLRFVPSNKIVVLGLVSTKVGKIETVDELSRRIDEATQYIPLEQLAISPQCGFASDVAGNLISEDNQKKKLEIVVETARNIWR